MQGVSSARPAGPSSGIPLPGSRTVLNCPGVPVSTPAGIRAALLAEWRLKLRLSAVLVPFFCVPYFVLQRVPLMDVRQLRPGWIEEAIGFHPEWAWMYQSAYLLIAGVPWLVASPEILRRYARGFVLLSCVGFICFLLFPLELSRPADTSVGGMYAWLVSYDRPLNTFPSLHVGLSAYTALLGVRLVRTWPAATMTASAMLTLWVCLIAFAAVAVRQHLVIDLPAGALLAWGSYRWAMKDR